MSTGPLVFLYGACGSLPCTQEGIAGPRWVLFNHFDKILQCEPVVICYKGFERIFGSGCQGIPFFDSLELSMLI